MPGDPVVLKADGRSGEVRGEAPAFLGDDRLIRVLWAGRPESHYEYRREDELEHAAEHAAERVGVAREGGGR